MDPKAQATLLADSYQGKRLNSPNDLVYKSDGTSTLPIRPMGSPSWTRIRPSNCSSTASTGIPGALPQAGRRARPGAVTAAGQRPASSQWNLLLSG